MIVTDVIELDKKRSKVFLDGEFAFVLYKGELRDYKIKVGSDLSLNTYDEITGTVLSKRVKLRAMNLLQKKDYTEKQLRDKLNEGLYSQELVDEAIDYVKSLGIWMMTVLPGTISHIICPCAVGTALYRTWFRRALARIF